MYLKLGILAFAGLGAGAVIAAGILPSSPSSACSRDSSA